MPSGSIGTAATAKAFLVLTTLATSSPTVGAVPEAPALQIRSTAIVPTSSRSLTTGGSSQAKTLFAKDDGYECIVRPTTQHEKLIGELRELSLLGSDWDGEGATAPSSQSLKAAEAFARLLDNIVLPEPMLLASGHISLYWNESNLYADIEFLGDGRIAYFIKRHGDKNKGVISFDSQKMPAVLQTLLKA